ncbi:hypothetical protein C0993_002999 [Termitomyces sp. T159_Od127]|nr:hypothetical protein C0993_002999 [Termitomyces sp. T159_Od127]
MDLTLWTASKNCLKGEWIKVGQSNVSSLIKVFMHFGRLAKLPPFSLKRLEEIPPQQDKLLGLSIPKSQALPGHHKLTLA